MTEREAMLLLQQRMHELECTVLAVAKRLAPALSECPAPERQVVIASGDAPLPLELERLAARIEASSACLWDMLCRLK